MFIDAVVISRCKAMPKRAAVVEGTLKSVAQLSRGPLGFSGFLAFPAGPACASRVTPKQGSIKLGYEKMILAGIEAPS
jgi:hypothetical protein